jgi:hypothetical protein
MQLDIRGSVSSRPGAQAMIRTTTSISSTANEIGNRTSRFAADRVRQRRSYGCRSACRLLDVDGVLLDTRIANAFITTGPHTVGTNW